MWLWCKVEWLKEGERGDVVVVKGEMVEQRRKGRCGCGERWNV